MNIEVALFIVAVIVFILFIAVMIIKGVKKLKENNYEKYKNENPHLVGNGRVQCKTCGSNIISIIDSGTTGYVAHKCNYCGEILYYSSTYK